MILKFKSRFQYCLVIWYYSLSELQYITLHLMSYFYIFVHIYILFHMLMLHIAPFGFITDLHATS